MLTRYRGASHPRVARTPSMPSCACHRGRRRRRACFHGRWADSCHNGSYRRRRDRLFSLRAAATTLGIAIRGNRIHGNGGLGIALDGAGLAPTPNDPDDADTGPNRLQNVPELARAIASEGGLAVDYFVPSHPDHSSYPIIVDFYLADDDGEEGRTWLGMGVFDEDAWEAGTPKQFAKNLFFLGDPPRLVATATDADGNTSEFSASVLVPEPAAASGAALLALALLGGVGHSARKRIPSSRVCSHDVGRALGGTEPRHHRGSSSHSS